MKAFRTVLFWCHLTVGVIVATIVVVMSATGVALTYQKQMQFRADTRGLETGPATPGAARLPVDSVLTLVQASTGSPAASAIIRAGANTPVEVTTGQGRVFVNAYTGAVLGAGNGTGTRQFFSMMTSWHRWLGRTDDNRAMGRAITGFCNAGFFFIVLSGLYLWFPKLWNWKQFRNILAFRGGLKAKARDFNWHNVIGFWSFVPLVFIVGSGVVMSYPWANALVYKSMGEEVPAGGRGGGPGGGRGGPGAPGGGREGRGGVEGRGGPGRGGLEGRGGGLAGDAGVALAAAGRIQGIDSALALVVAKVPGWKSVTVQVPDAAAGTVTLSVDAGLGGQPQLRNAATFARATNTLTLNNDFAAQSRGRRLRSFLRFAHTGEYYGVTGQTIAGLATFGSLVLVWTGLALALRRFFAWRRRKARAVVPAVATPEPELEPVG